MSINLKTETIALRDKAWEGVKSTQEFALFKALDEAVAAVGGASISGGLAKVPPQNWLPKSANVAGAGARALSQPKRLSQTEVAAQVLREMDEPLPIGRLLECVIAKGVVFRGENPLPSFRSAMSKDARLVSIMRGNMYFWWFSDRPVPAHWNTEGGLDLVGNPPAVSHYSSQEGGDVHAATITTS